MKKTEKKYTFTFTDGADTLEKTADTLEKTDHIYYDTIMMTGECSIPNLDVNIYNVSETRIDDIEYEKLIELLSSFNATDISMLVIRYEFIPNRFKWNCSRKTLDYIKQTINNKIDPYIKELEELNNVEESFFNNVKTKKKLLKNTIFKLCGYTSEYSYEHYFYDNGRHLKKNVLKFTDFITLDNDIDDYVMYELNSTFNNLLCKDFYTDIITPLEKEHIDDYIHRYNSHSQYKNSSLVKTIRQNFNFYKNMTVFEINKRNSLNSISMHRLDAFDIVDDTLTVTYSDKMRYHSLKSASLYYTYTFNIKKNDVMLIDYNVSLKI